MLKKIFDNFIIVIIVALSGAIAFIANNEKITIFVITIATTMIMARVSIEILLGLCAMMIICLLLIPSLSETVALALVVSIPLTKAISRTQELADRKLAKNKRPAS